jgi:hypothetical protein
MRKTEENYQRITDDKRLLDVRFCQSQGDNAIFEARQLGTINLFYAIKQHWRYRRMIFL